MCSCVPAPGKGLTLLPTREALGFVDREAAVGSVSGRPHRMELKVEAGYHLLAPRSCKRQAALQDERQAKHYSA